MVISELESIWQKMKVHPITGEQKSFPIGSDGMSTMVFEKNLDLQLKEITRKINARNEYGEPLYSFGTLVFYERKKASGGTRRIYLPRLKDQLVLKWIHTHLIESAKKKQITLQTQSPLEVVERFRNELAQIENPIVVRTDISSFFDSVPRDRVVDLALSLDLSAEVGLMLKVWAKKIIGRPFWITGKSSDEEVLGLPQGLSISATLAELWGTEIERKMSAYVKVFRFVDDICFVTNSQEEAERYLDALGTIISEMGLTISEKKTHIASLSEGIPWLGMVHYPSEIIAESSRLEKWSKRFIFMRKEVSQEYKLNPHQDKNQLLESFYYKVKQELKGKTSARPQWYSIVKDDGQWKKMDQLLHAQFKILHKQLGIPLDPEAKLPSIHKQMISRNKK